MNIEIYLSLIKNLIMACKNQKCNCTNCVNDKCNCDGTKECSCAPESTSCCCENKLQLVCC